MRQTVNDDISRKMMEVIRRNIAEAGQHITLVQQFSIPRFAYTIGLLPQVGAELIMPGAVIFDAKELFTILSHISTQLKQHPFERTIEIGKLGQFRLVESDSSWTNEFMLGVFDYFKASAAMALQVFPDGEHITIDVPDTSLPWDPTQQPVWRWLKEPWTWSVPEGSTAVTNLAALRGYAVTEASRWGIDEWELFAGSGPDTPEEELRVVPIATLVGPDPSLLPVLSLEVGKSLWRPPGENDWQEW